jgi:hypothetical protein
MFSGKRSGGGDEERQTLAVLHVELFPHSDVTEDEREMKTVVTASTVTTW